MKAQDLLLILTVVCVVVVALLHLSSLQHATCGDVGDQQMRELDTLRKLVLLQNDTIHVLELHLDNVMRMTGSMVTEGHDTTTTSYTRSQTKAVTLTNNYEVSHSLEEFRSHKQSMEDCSGGTRNQSMSAIQHAGLLYGEHMMYPRRERMSTMEIDCEKRYGMELASEWRKSAQVWCEGK